MAEEVIRRQGSATDHGSFTGAAGEITVENTNWNLRIHDGVTAGGHTTLMDSDLANGSGSGVLRADVNEVVTGKREYTQQEEILGFNPLSGRSINVQGGVPVGDITGVTGWSSSATHTQQWRLSGGSESDNLAGISFTKFSTNVLSLDLDAQTLAFGSVAFQEQNSANFEILYENGNRVLTDYVFDAYLDGQIDYDHYDALMGTRMVESETETEEVEEDGEVTEPVTTVREEWDEKQQAYIRRTITEQRPVYDEYSVKDEQCNEVGKKRVQRTQKVKKQVPKQVEVRDEHAPAKRYEFDDLDCDAFWSKCEKFRKLPAFQRYEDNLREGQQRPSMGQVAQALTETVEDMAVHIHELNERLKKLER